MLQDSVTLISGAQFKGFSVESGVAFPPAPSAGQKFTLSVANADYEAGEYRYDAINNEWINDLILFSRASDFTQVGKKGSIPKLNQTTAVPYDIGIQILSKPEANAVVARFIAPRSFKIAAAMAGSIGNAGVAPTGAVILIVKKNGTQIGSVNFAAGQVTPTFVAATETTFAKGDIFTVTAPATADATFADAQVTFIAALV